MIGLFDCVLLLLSALLAILASLQPQSSLFLLPLTQSWVIAVYILAVELPRVIAFGLLARRPDWRRPRLLMGVTRVATQGLHVYLLVYSFLQTGVGAHPGLLAANVMLLMTDTYLTAVIFAWWRRSPQEVIEIEL